MWAEDAPSEHSVAATFVRFQETNREFLRDFQLAFAEPGLSEAPQRVWRLSRMLREVPCHARGYSTSRPWACSLVEGVTVFYRDLKESLTIP